MSKSKKQQIEIMKAAFNALGFEYDENYKNEADLDREIKEKEDLKEQCLEKIESLKEAFGTIEKYIEQMKMIKQQFEIEEYRLMNPHAKEIYKF